MRPDTLVSSQSGLRTPAYAKRLRCFRRPRASGAEHRLAFDADVGIKVRNLVGVVEHSATVVVDTAFPRPPAKSPDGPLVTFGTGPKERLVQHNSWAQEFS